MNGKNWLRALLVASLFGIITTPAHADGTVKLGMIGEYSGPFADYGQQMYNGMKAYMLLHGDTVAGKKIEIIQKDTGGPAPDVAKRLAQELVTRDNVDILVGFGLTPNALAVAPIATEAKKPMVLMNAATSTSRPSHRTSSACRWRCRRSRSRSRSGPPRMASRAC